MYAKHSDIDYISQETSRSTRGRTRWWRAVVLLTSMGVKHLPNKLNMCGAVVSVQKIRFGMYFFFKTYVEISASRCPAASESKTFVRGRDTSSVMRPNRPSRHHSATSRSYLSSTRPLPTLSFCLLARHATYAFLLTIVQTWQRKPPCCTGYVVMHVCSPPHHVVRLSPLQRPNSQQADTHHTEPLLLRKLTKTTPHSLAASGK